MTLNEISYFIAERFGKDEDEAFIEQIKFSVKYYRALLIRRDAERNQTNRTYLQNFIQPLIKVDEADTCVTQIGCEILRTENKVPKPIRLKQDTPFTFVGSVGYKKGITYMSPSLIEDLKFLPYIANEWFYTYINEYIYLYNMNKIKRILIEASFEDPTKALTLCENSVNCVNDNEEFPLSADMVQQVIQSILGGEFQLVNPQDKEIDIDDND